VLRHRKSGFDMGPQEVLLIRHAITDMAGTLCGQSDPPLNAIGRDQAESLAQRLRACNIRRLYTSDLQRAIQTAQPIARLGGVPIVATRALREIYFGYWEGKRWSQVRGERPDITSIESLSDFSAPGGESFVCFRDRVVRVLNEIITRSEGQPAAVITHLGVICLILRELKTANHVCVRQQRIDYCSVQRVRVSGPVLRMIGKHESL
jgi:broad specificity phosphatase PhoE